MPDHFTYTLDGDLTIKATGQNAGARMDFHAWLLKPPDNGNGDFQGYFQYAGGNFDGRLWGQLNFMNGLASLDLGSSANNAAVDMHFGNGPWHIDAGKKEGPRIQGHFLVSDANMYCHAVRPGTRHGRRREHRSRSRRQLGGVGIRERQRRRGRHDHAAAAHLRETFRPMQVPASACRVLAFPIG